MSCQILQLDVTTKAMPCHIGPHSHAYPQISALSEGLTQSKLLRWLSTTPEVDGLWQIPNWNLLP